MRKKILLGCLVAICAVTGGLALASCAPAEQLAYEKIAGEEAYRVVGIGTMKTRDVVIPATYEGLPYQSF